MISRRFFLNFASKLGLFALFCKARFVSSESYCIEDEALCKVSEGGIFSALGNLDRVFSLSAPMTNLVGTILLRRKINLPKPIAELGTLVFRVDKYIEGADSISSYLLEIRSSNLINQVTCMNDSATVSPPGSRWVCAHVSEFEDFFNKNFDSVYLAIKASQRRPFLGKVAFSPIFHSVKRRPTVVITFDDLHSSIYDLAFPFLKKRNLCCTLYVPKDFVGKVKKLRLEQIVDMYESGWDMACDSTPDDTLTKILDIERSVRDILINRDFLVSQGLTRAADHFCWTFGRWDIAVANEFRSVGFKSGRSVEPQAFYDGFGLLDIDMTIPSCGASVGNDTTRLYKQLDEVVRRGVTQFFHFHNIVQDGQKDGFYFSGFLDFVEKIYFLRNSGAVDVLTISQWWNRVRKDRIENSPNII